MGMDDKNGLKFVRNLDWNLLRMYVTLVDARSITLAAEKLGLQQPSVSAALKRLEMVLDKKLIERGPGKFYVTDAGNELYREAVEIKGSIYRLGISMRDVTETVKGHIRIFMASHVLCPFFDDVLSEFHTKHPHASIEISIGPSPKVIENITSRKASFGICLAYTKHPKLEYKHMFREYFGLFCSKKHPLFGKEGLTTDDLAGNNWVSFITDQMSDVLQPVTLLRASAAPEDAIIGSSANLEEVRRMILSGLGIGPLPLHVAKRDVDAGLLFRLPPYENPPEIDVYVVSNPITKLSRAEAIMLEMLNDRIDQIPLGLRTYDDMNTN